jgi:hypothetical protein
MIREVDTTASGNRRSGHLQCALSAPSVVTDNRPKVLGGQAGALRHVVTVCSHAIFALQE